MRYGFVLPYADPRTAADLAYEVEMAGWDGFFVWEPIWGFDAWVILAAAAMRTSRIRLGTMLSPISRMRPWKLASETVALDHLSGGRVTLAVGLGAVDTGFAAFGEATDRKVRAELVDEGLAVLTGLWGGQPFQFEGKHYHVQPTDFLPPPPPVQQPRIPIWVVGVWPSPKSMARALAYDGLIPSVIRPPADGAGPPVAQQATAEDLHAIQAHLRTHPTATTPYDIVVEGVTPGDDPAKAAAVVQPWAEAGATWWIEAMWDAMEPPGGPEAVRRRIRQGPPGAGGR